MEKRKLIAFGSSSFIVSVPKAWIKENRLKKGDTVTLEEKDNELIFSAGNKEDRDEEQSIFINAEGKDLPLVKSEIVSAYLNNYTVIDISGVSRKDDVVKIKDTLRGLIGLEIIRQEYEKICVKDLLDLREVSIETIIRRMDNIIRSMVLDSVRSIEEDRSEDIYERDQEVNRLFFLASRTIRAAMQNHSLAKQMKVSSVDLLFSWTIVNRMEKVGDLVKRMTRAMRAASLSKEEKEELRNAYQQYYDDYNIVMRSYYKRERDVALRSEIRSRDMIICCRTIIEANKGIDFRNLFHYLMRMVTCNREISRSVVGMENGAENGPKNGVRSGTKNGMEIGTENGAINITPI